MATAAQPAASSDGPSPEGHEPPAPDPAAHGGQDGQSPSSVSYPKEGVTTISTSSEAVAREMQQNIYSRGRKAGRVIHPEVYSKDGKWFVDTPTASLEGAKSLSPEELDKLNSKVTEQLRSGFGAEHASRLTEGREGNSVIRMKGEDAANAVAEKLKEEGIAGAAVRKEGVTDTWVVDVPNDQRIARGISEERLEAIKTEVIQSNPAFLHEATPTTIKPDVSPDFAGKINQGYENISPGTRQYLEEQGVRMHVAAKPKDHLKPGESETWQGANTGDTRTNVNQVGGWYNGGDNDIRVSETYQDHNGNWTQTRNANTLAAHEMGHAFDRNAIPASQRGGTQLSASDTKSFKEAYDADVAAMGGRDKAIADGYGYFVSNKDTEQQQSMARAEVFTEQWASLHGGGEVPSVAQDFPRTRQWMEEFDKGHEQARAQSPQATRDFVVDFGENRALPPEILKPSPEMTVPEIPEGAGRSAGATASGLLTYTGIVQVGRGLDEIGHHEYIKGAGDYGLGATSTVVGAAGTVESVAPGTVEKYAGRTLAEGMESAAPVLMGAQAAYTIATAPAGEKGKAAYRETGSLAPAIAVMGGEGAGAILWPVGVGIVGGMAVERDITLTELQQKHDKAMQDIKPDAAHTHLREEADKLQNTLVLAQAGDTLAKDGSGKIDINSEANLAKIKSFLPEDKQRELERNSAAAADAQVERLRIASINPETGGDGYSPKQLEEFRAQAVKDNEKATLQGMAIEMQYASDARRDYFPPDAKLALDQNGRIDLSNSDNLTTLRGVFNREHDAMMKASVNTDQISPYWNMTSGEATLRQHIGNEEQRQKTDTAIADLNNIEFGGRALNSNSVTPEQRAKDIATLQATNDPDKVTTYTATVQRDDKGNMVGDPIVSDPRADKSLYETAMKEYEAHPQEYRARGGIVPVPLYKLNDDQSLALDKDGKPVVEKLVQWRVMDPDLPPASAQAQPAVSQAPTAASSSPEEKARQQAMASVNGGQKFNYASVSDNQVAMQNVTMAKQQQATRAQH